MAAGGSAPDVPGLYMVDARFPDPVRLPAWLDWYNRHIDMLLRDVSMFVAAQRFRAVGADSADFLGVYSLTSGRMFASTEYLSRGGQYPPEWLDLVRDWYRGFYTGLESLTEVRSGEVLLVTDRRPEEVASLGIDFLWVNEAGLRARAPQRGLAIVPKETGMRLAGERGQSLTAFAPLTPRQVKPTTS